MLSTAWYRLDTLQSGADEDAHARRRVWFLRICLLGLVLVSVLFYLLPQPDYDHSIHLLGAVFYVALFLALRWGAPTAAIVHVGLTVTLLHVGWVAAQTGGINSVAMAWMTVVILPATLLLQRAGALLWAALAVLFNLVFLVLTDMGWMGSHVRMDAALMGWTLVHKVLVACLAMAVVWLAERMHNQQVEQLDKSNQALEKTAQDLRQAQAHKEEFIASVGHELRTPMNAILGLNNILKTELSHSPEGVEIVGHIRSSTQQLLGLVNDILDFSQLQAGHLSLRDERFDLCLAVQGLLDTYADKAIAKGVALRLDDSAVRGQWVRGDLVRLQQVLKNLLDNALKFTAQGQVQVRLLREVTGFRFEVEDTGIGIVPERQQQVFNRFEHADAQTKREYGGTGLGLSICERLVSLQGGHIGVHSEPGQGTLFWFDLPLSSTQADTRDQGQKPSIQTPWRILLVDDNAVNLMVARMMLNKFLPQARITEADSGQEALQCLAKQHFDLVLMDMVMPDMDGLETTHILRTTLPPPACDVPVLGLTASTHPADRDKCLAAGMNEVLNKPLDESQLMAQLSRMVGIGSGQAVS
jgi:signal transduction histidine kinase/CheY-like chemotaxis protein